MYFTQSFLYSCRILTKLEFFSTDFGEKAQNNIFIKMRAVGAELFHADGWTDRRGEGTSRFSQLCKREGKWTARLKGKSIKQQEF